MSSIFKSLLSFLILLLAFNLIAQSNSRSILDKRTPKSPTKVDKRDRIDMAIQQEFEMTKDLSMDMVPRYKLKAAREIADNKRSQLSNPINKAQVSGILGIQWEERGPSNVGGRTRSILVDKGDATGNTVFAGSVAGGLWKSTEANSATPNWQKVDDFLENLAVSSIVQDPNNHDILYFSTGEGYYNIDAVQGNGLYKSTDHGVSWQKLASTDNEIFYFTQRLLIDDQGSIFAATFNHGLQKSIDGGASFTKILGTSNWAIENTIIDVEQASDGDLYASVGMYNSDGIYKSIDGGSNWMKLTNGLPVTDHGRIELACAKSNSDYIYAVINSISSDNCLGIFRTTNGGDNWIEVDNPTMFGNTNFLRKQGWYNMAVAVDPQDESTVYIGGIDLFKSTNAGLNFSQISQWYGAQQMEEVHADQHVITFGHNDSDRLYVGNDGGIFMSDNASSTNVEFLNINTGYNVTQFYAADFHPEAGNPLISAGAQDNGTQLFTVNGMNATQELTGGDGGFTHFDDNDGNLLITTYIFNNFRVSTDMGNSFTYRSFGNSGRFINANDFDSEANLMYSGHNDGQFLRWNDPVEMGYDIDTVLVTELTNEMVSSVKLSPNVPNRVYFGTGNGKLIRVDNAHLASSYSGQNLFEGSGYLSGIAIEKGNESHILITYSNYGLTSIYETIDDGLSWMAVEGDLPDMPVRWIEFSPVNANQALIATELGVWSTKNLDAQNTIWDPSNGGLANVRTDMLKIRKSDNMMLAATHGRGLFTTDFYANPQVNFELDSINIYEASTSQKMQGCLYDYTTLYIPINFSSTPNGSEKIKLEIVESDAIADFDFIIVKDSVYLSENNQSDYFEIQYIDDSMEEMPKYVKAVLSAENDIIGSANEIYINLLDDDINPLNLPTVSSHQIGTGNNLESNAPFKSYYEDEKTQYIFKADELLANGLVAGNLTSISLNIAEKNSTLPFSNFTVKLAQTNVNQFAIQNAAFIQESNEIVYQDDFNTQVGWNVITFDAPFMWDGISNLLIEICYDNSDYSSDDKLFASSTSFFGAQYKYIDGVSGCSLTSSPTVKMVRPNMKFEKQLDIIASKKQYVKSSPTQFPGLNNFYDDDANIISTIEYQLGPSSSCFTTEIAAYGTDIESPAWLVDHSIAEKQFFFSSIDEFYGSIQLYFTTAELGSWANINELSILRTAGRIDEQTGSEFEVIPSSEVIVSEIKPDLFMFSFLTNSLGGFTLTDYQASTVPVTLVDFNAERHGEANLISWDVESEYDLEGYMLERSFDGKNFEKLEFVQANEDLEIQKSYRYIDQDLFFTNKNYYYRLRIAEMDGSDKYSDIIAVFVSEQTIAHLDVFPNPVDELLFVNLKQTNHTISTYQLSDIRGNILITNTEIGLSKTEINMKKLLPGIYILRLTDSNNKVFQKTIIKR